jgi:hypothetical protein
MLILALLFMTTAVICSARSRSRSRARKAIEYSQLGR